MLEFFGYILLVLTIAGSIAIAWYTQNYLDVIICLWLGVTVSSMMILHFKQV